MGFVRINHVTNYPLLTTLTLKRRWRRCLWTHHCCTFSFLRWHHYSTCWWSLSNSTPWRFSHHFTYLQWRLKRICDTIYKNTPLWWFCDQLQNIILYQIYRWYFLFVGLHFTLRNFKMRRSAKNKNWTWAQIVRCVCSSVQIVSTDGLPCKLQVNSKYKIRF